MEKPCSPGYTIDSLLKVCIKDTLGNPEQTVTADTDKVLTGAPSHSWNAVSPGVWICAGVILGSLILTFLLWFIIYKRHTHNTGNRSFSTVESLQHNGNAKVRPSLEETEDPPSSCPHVNGRTQEVSICEMGLGRGICNGRAEHGVPLPATELGDSALVTTKTVQNVEV